MRESLKNFDPIKLADLDNKVTPYDVILFGKNAKAVTADLQRRRKHSTEPVAESSETHWGRGDVSKKAPRLSASEVKALKEDLAIRERCSRVSDCTPKNLLRATTGSFQVSARQTESRF